MATPASQASASTILHPASGGLFSSRNSSAHFAKSPANDDLRGLFGLPGYDEEMLKRPCSASISSLGLLKSPSLDERLEQDLHESPNNLQSLDAHESPKDQHNIQREVEETTESMCLANYVLEKAHPAFSPYAQRPRSQDLHIDTSLSTNVFSSSAESAVSEEMFPSFNRAPRSKVFKGRAGFPEKAATCDGFHFAPNFEPQTQNEDGPDQISEQFQNGNGNYGLESHNSQVKSESQTDISPFTYGYIPRNIANTDSYDYEYTLDGPDVFLESNSQSATVGSNYFSSKGLDFYNTESSESNYVKMEDMSLIKQLTPPGSGAQFPSLTQNTANGDSSGSIKSLDDFIKLTSNPDYVYMPAPCPTDLALELRKSNASLVESSGIKRTRIVSGSQMPEPPLKRPRAVPGNYRVSKDCGPRRAKREKRVFDYSGVHIPVVAMESNYLQNNARAPICNNDFRSQVVELSDQSECAIKRVRHERGSLDALDNLHPDVYYEKNSYFDIKHPYQQEFTRVELDPVTGGQLMETRSALCAYCEDLNFYELKNSCYSQHMSHSHGIFTDDYLAPDPLFIGTYRVTKKYSSARKTVPRVRCHEGVVCPACYEVVEIRCWSSTSQKKPLSNYLRHFKECHRVDKRRDTFFSM